MTDSEQVLLCPVVQISMIILSYLRVTTSAAEICHQPLGFSLSLPSMEVHSMKGDVVFGIVTPLHLETVYPSQNLLFIEPPAPRHCEKVQSALYQDVFAMIFAISEINRSPTLLPNTTLGFRIYDSCYSEFRAIEGTLHLLSGWKDSIPNYRCQSTPKLAGIIGDSTSSGCLPMAKILGVSRIPQISHAAVLPILSDKFQFPSFLRTVPSASFQPYALVKLLLHFGWTWIGILVSNNELSLQGSQVLKEQAARNGICIEFFEILPTQTTRTSITHAFNFVKTSTANVIVCYVFPVHITPLLKEFSLHGISGKIWIGLPSWVPSAVFSNRDLFDTLNGTLGFALYSSDIPGFKEFLYNVNPLKDTEDTFTKAFWEHVFSCNWMDTLNEKNDGIISHAKQLCTGTEKLEAANASVFEVNNFRFQYSAYNAIYAMAQGLDDLLKCNPGTGPFTKKSCADPKHFKPWQILHYVKKTHMVTPNSSELFFDAFGDGPPVLNLLNWHVTLNGTTRLVKFGTYDARAPPGFQLVINESIIVWGRKHTQVPSSVCTESCVPGFRRSAIEGRQKCCFHCMPCPEGSITNLTDSLVCILCPSDHWSNHEKSSCIPKIIEFLSYEEPLGFILALVSIFLILNAVSILFIFTRYEHTPVVRANNLQLSYILLVSLIFSFLSSLIFIGQPRRVTCILRQVIFGTCFSVSVSCVLAKTTTVVIAFRATKPNSTFRRWLGYQTSYSIVLTGFFIQFAIAAVWLGTAPPFPEFNMSATIGKITVECNEGSILMFYCMLAFMGLLACASFGVAFLARNLPDSFNEAKFITFSMLVFISVWLSFIPAYLSTKGKYLVAVEIFAILSSGAGLLFCIFAHKIYIIFLRPDMNTKNYLISKSTSVNRNN